MENKSSNVKIIQILLTPNSMEHQGKLMGLGDDGVVYIAEHFEGSTIWVAVIK